MDAEQIIETPPAEPSADSAFVTLVELARRWGITEPGVRSRLKRRGLDIVRDELDHPAARALQVNAVEWDVLAPSPAAEPPSASPTSGNGASSEAEKPEPLPFERLDVPAPSEKPAAPAEAKPSERAIERDRGVDAVWRLLPTTNIVMGVGDESAKVRRLLLALSKIRRLADRDDDLLLLAIHAVADYALEAES